MTTTFVSEHDPLDEELPLGLEVESELLDDEQQQELSLSLGELLSLENDSELLHSELSDELLSLDELLTEESEHELLLSLDELLDAELELEELLLKDELLELLSLDELTLEIEL